MRFSVDSWDPGYGLAVDIQELADTDANVDVSVELSGSDWSPVAPSATTPLPRAILFVDGVRRIEAQAWIDDTNAPNEAMRRAVPGLCASYAAGAVCCCETGSHLLTSEVRRGLFTDASSGDHIQTRTSTYVLHRTVVSAIEAPTASLTNALQRALTDLEITVAVAARNEMPSHASEDDLLIVDGPLRGRAHLPRAMGYVKTHNAQYLPGNLNATVAQLATGDRTPVFAIGAGWDRYSWYLRLPCLPAGPWAGIVRLEAPIDLAIGQVVTLANTTQILLGRFASVEYKDGRAPQNLVPIGGLENELRHRLGSAPLMYRELRAAAITPPGQPRQAS